MQGENFFRRMINYFIQLLFNGKDWRSLPVLGILLQSHGDHKVTHDYVPPVNIDRRYGAVANTVQRQRCNDQGAAEMVTGSPRYFEASKSIF